MKKIIRALAGPFMVIFSIGCSKANTTNVKIDYGTSDEEYTDWPWWLARSDGGEWKLMTYGYA